MSARKAPAGKQRFSGYQAMLDEASRQALPWICENPADIEKLLALQGASLIEAQFDPPTFFRDGTKQISRAVVTAVTIEGRQALHNTEKKAVSGMTLSGRNALFSDIP